MKKRVDFWSILIYMFVGIFSFICLYPFVMTISGSFSSQKDIMNYGYSIIPRHFITDAYKALFINKALVISAYKVTIFVTVVGTFFSVIINSMMGFVLSRKRLRFRRVLNVYVLITMLFSGGLVPWYIVCIHYLHLKNTIMALIVPIIVSAWNIFLIRNFFNSIPEEMYESAKVDGASDFTIYHRIYLRLSTSVLAVVLLFTALGYWNDWFLGLMLVDDSSLQPLQLLLRSIISNIQFLQSMQQSPDLQRLISAVPSQGIQMAMVIVTTGPIILLYPFLQRYFVKGIMIGAVKG